MNRSPRRSNVSRSAAALGAAAALTSLFFGAGSASAVPVLTTLAHFNGTNGANPFSGVVADASGNLYGTASGGGSNSLGTLYRVPSAGGSLTTLLNFSSGTGATPNGGLRFDAQGRLQGTTSTGGTLGGGTVFRVSTTGGAFTTLASLSTSTGSSATGTLIADPDGNLYGTAAFGGAFGRGTIFRVPAAGGVATVLASMSITSGGAPQGGVVADAAGNLYATASNSAANGRGSVVRIPKTGTGNTFGGGTVAPYFVMANATGANPQGALVADSTGNLYGTAAFGGANGQGVVFQIPAGAPYISVLATFNGTNGANPYSGLLVDAAGNLYGTTSAGGASNRGTIFKVPNGGGSVVTLASFSGANGASPFSGLTADLNGNLYGTTNLGGTNNVGTVYRLSDTGFVVPEPAALGLLLPAVTMLGARRRR